MSLDLEGERQYSLHTSGLAMSAMATMSRKRIPEHDLSRPFPVNEATLWGMNSLTNIMEAYSEDFMLLEIVDTRHCLDLEAL